MHSAEYDEYTALKLRGAARPIIPIEEGNKIKFPQKQLNSKYLLQKIRLVSDDQSLVIQEPISRYPQTLFEHGFFEIVVRLPNRVIKANCLTCQRLGRANLIQAREYSSSNLLGHLKVSLSEYFLISHV